MCVYVEGVLTGLTATPGTRMYNIYVPASIIVWEVGELCMFFWSSSELWSTAVELERSGNPSDSRRDDELAADAAELAAVFSLAAFSLFRFPYLFFRYLAQELSAAPSLSPVPVGVQRFNMKLYTTRRMKRWDKYAGCDFRLGASYMA